MSEEYRGESSLDTGASSEEFSLESDSSGTVEIEVSVFEDAIVNFFSEVFVLAGNDGSERECFPWRLSVSVFDTSVFLSLMPSKTFSDENVVFLRVLLSLCCKGLSSL